MTIEFNLEQMQRIQQLQACLQCIKKYPRKYLASYLFFCNRGGYSFRYIDHLILQADISASVTGRKQYSLYSETLEQDIRVGLDMQYLFVGKHDLLRVGPLVLQSVGLDPPRELFLMKKNDTWPKKLALEDTTLIGTAASVLYCAYGDAGSSREHWLSTMVEEDGDAIVKAVQFLEWYKFDITKFIRKKINYPYGLSYEG